MHWLLCWAGLLALSVTHRLQRPKPPYSLHTSSDHMATLSA